jgi:hypothetical protein
LHLLEPDAEQAAQHGGVDVSRRSGRSRAEDDLLARLELGPGPHPERATEVADPDVLADIADEGEAAEVDLHAFRMRDRFRNQR